MSQHAQNCVWQESQHKGSTLVFLLAIADYANDHGLAYPGIETLAKKCRMTERNVINTKDRALESGELAVFERASPYGTNLYQIILPGLADEKFALSEALIILDRTAKGKTTPISGGENFSHENLDVEFSQNPRESLSLSSSDESLVKEGLGEKSRSEISGVEDLSHAAADMIAGWGALTEGKRDDDWPSAPDHLKGILIAFTEVWRDVFDRDLLGGDRGIFLRQAETLREHWGEGVAEFMMAAGKKHKERIDAGADLPLNGPLSIEWAIRDAIHEAIGEEKAAEKFKDFWDPPMEAG
jgi:hypothetical protein